jgi:adenosylcobinamide-GDP ribazoletransferase
MPAVRAAVAAVTFLTRLPLGRWVATGPADVARGAPLFPLVGAGVGAAAAGAALLVQPPLSPLLAAAIATALTVALTGAFHLDGLADTLDATGGMTRERSLEIMRDSRIGTFGAAGLALALLVRVAAITQLVGSGGVLGGLIAAGAASRGAAVALAAAVPYARAAPGRGGVLTGRIGLWGAPVGAAVAVAALRLDGLVVVGAVAAVAIGLGLVYRRWLGGVTGDTLGATSEATELLALVIAASLA